MAGNYIELQETGNRDGKRRMYDGKISVFGTLQRAMID